VPRKEQVYIWVDGNGKNLTPLGIRSQDCPVCCQPLCIKYVGGGVAKETPGSPTSKSSKQCKIIDEEDAKYIVPKMDITYSLREEEDKGNV
jgi:hypothetical protein